MQIQKGSWFPTLIGLFVLIAIAIPFVYAANTAGGDYVFGRYLLNPLDGFTYLAKMYQGWEGNWRNQMAYTSDPGEGAYINLYYLFLGHLARWLNMPLILVYHAARLLGAVLMLWMLWRFFGEIFFEGRVHRLAFTLAALGSGLGWVMIPFGQYTSDLWVAELYPFLSAFTNPHFPLGLSMVLWLLLPQHKGSLWWQGVKLILMSLLISIVSPFGLVVVLTVLGGHFVYLFFAKQAWKEIHILREQFVRILLIVIAGAPLMLYYAWIAANDPVISVWNEQNLTLSPPLWDLLVSLSPTLILAGVGIWAISKEISLEKTTLSECHLFILIIWMVLGLILVYLPFGLQRRFLTGLYVPLAGLAAYGIFKLGVQRPNSVRLWVVALFTLVIPTNLVVMLAGFHGARTHDANLYLSTEEASALQWVVENTPAEALILSSPEMGIFIPAVTSRRVIYGHPYETIYADLEREFVEQLYAGAFTQERRNSLITERGVDYILCGPREQAISAECLDWEYEKMFSDGGVLLFATGE